MYKMLKLEPKMAEYFIDKFGFDKKLSVFGSCDDRGFLALCFYDATKEPAEIIGFHVYEKTEECYWVENLIRATINSLELSGSLVCEYRGSDYIPQFKASRFTEKNGILIADLKAIFAAGGPCCHG
jgi:hypothetical protein